MPIELPRLTLADVALWRQWLAAEHATSKGVWLTIAKKGVEKPTSLTWQQAIEEAMCYGWIDGQARKRDEGTYAHRFTPRAAKSMWSKRNVGIIERLEAEGRLHAAGRIAVEAAKEDGRWDAAYAGSADAEAPADFLAALDEVPSARSTWDGLDKQNRYAVYLRLHSLKTPAGREKRIQAFVELLARGDKPTRAQRKAVQTKHEKKGTVPKALEVAQPAGQNRSGRKAFGGY